VAVKNCQEMSRYWKLAPGVPGVRYPREFGGGVIRVERSHLLHVQVKPEVDVEVVPNDLSAHPHECDERIGAKLRIFCILEETEMFADHHFPSPTCRASIATPMKARGTLPPPAGGIVPRDSLPYTHRTAGEPIFSEPLPSRMHSCPPGGCTPVAEDARRRELPGSRTHRD